MNIFFRTITAMVVLWSLLMACQFQRAIAQQQNLYTYELITPRRAEQGMPFPMVIRMLRPSGPIHQEQTFSTAFTSPEYIQNDIITLQRGTATFAPIVQSSDSFTLQLPLRDTILTKHIDVVSAYPSITYEGTLPKQNIVWDASADRIVQGDLVIPEDATLSIQPGTMVKTSKEANIIVYGKLVVEGSHNAPVVFTSQSPSAPWGGIIINNTEASFSHCFCMYGGADTTRKFAHSNSQAVIQIEKSKVALNNTWLVYNTGKAFGVRNSTITGDSLVIAYCDTGGEFWSTLVHFNHSAVQNIPDGDGRIDDDDNDGWYFAGSPQNTSAYSIVANSVIATTEDDCIDHNGAHLLIYNCVLENAYHEGLAASYSDTAIIVNSLVRACEQGIEAGYGAPTVIVDHCFVADNKIGLRFGDSNTLDCTGSITATNTILHNNTDNIWNYELKTQAPVEGAIAITYSITNDSDYDSSFRCLKGIPTTDAAYLVQPESIGKQAGTAGSDMGLVQGEDPYCRVVITELYWKHPQEKSRSWIELHNRCPLPIDISTWTLGNGIASFVFPDNSIIPSHGFIVLSPDTILFRQHYSHPVQLFGNSRFTLDTAGLLLLQDAQQHNVDSVFYSLQPPWPSPIDYPNSIVLATPWLNNADGSNWVWSQKREGTPSYHLMYTTSSMQIPEIQHNPFLPLAVSPTPCQNECVLTYYLPSQGLVEFEVYLLTGQKVQSIPYQEQQVGYHSYKLSCQSLPTGTFYIVQKLNGTIITTGSGIHIKKQ